MQEPEKHSNLGFEQDSLSGKSEPPPPYNLATSDSYPPGIYPPGPGPAYCPPASGPAYCPPASGPAYCPPASGPAYCPPGSGPAYPPGSGPAYCTPASGPAYYPPGSGPAYYPPGPGGTQGPGYQPYYPNTTSPGVQQPLIYQPTSNVVMMNTQTAVVRPNYNDYLCWSILNCLCCCWPLGLAAIIYSCKTRSDITDRNNEAAARHSRATRNLNIWALVIGLIINIMVTVIYWKYFQHHRNF